VSRFLGACIRYGTIYLLNDACAELRAVTGIESTAERGLYGGRSGITANPRGELLASLDMGDDSNLDEDEADDSNDQSDQDQDANEGGGDEQSASEKGEMEASEDSTDDREEGASEAAEAPAGEFSDESDLTDAEEAAEMSRPPA